MRSLAAITGGGIICSVGMGRREVHGALLQGQLGARPVAAFEVAGLGCRLAAPMVEFDPLRYLSRRQVKMLDRLSWATLAVTQQALDDAGNPQAAFPSEQSGIAVASSYATTGNLRQFYSDLATAGPQHVNPLWLRNSNPSSLMMLGAIQHKLQGVNLTLSSGETAGIEGLLHCANTLNTGAGAVMLLLGCENVWLELQRYFEQQGLLAADRERSIPYGKESSGAILGECVAGLVLEPTEQAERRGARILAQVLAVASRVGEPRRALRSAVEQVLSRSGARPTEIRFIVGAGNGVPEQDRLELDVLGETFKADPPLLTSVKGATGECLGAGGLIGILAAMESASSGSLPPVPGLERDAPETGLRLVCGQPAEVERGLALIVTLGHLGGAAVALLRL